MKRSRGRDREGFASTLPVWEVEDGTKPGTLHLTCKNCQGKIVVAHKRFVDGPTNAEFLGRPCPYCFRTSRIPLKYMNRRTKRLYNHGGE